LENKEKIPEGLNIGTKVKVGKVSTEGWVNQYFAERQKTIPSSSVGEIIDIWKDGQFMIRFQDVKETAWTVTYDGFAPYFKKGWNIATYHIEELEPLPSIDEVEKHQFQFELDKLKGYFKGD